MRVVRAQEVRTMDRQRQDRPTGRGRARSLAGLLLAGTVTAWLAAALLVWGLAPLLVADSALAGEAEAVHRVVGAFALADVLAGGVLLAGLATVWFAPRRAAGRVLLLVAGMVAVAGGLLLLNVGALQIPWRGGAAQVGVAGAVATVAVGLLAAAASVSDRLPGPSLAERMTSPGTAPAATLARERMWPLTAALAVGWVVSTGAVLTRSDPPWLLVGFLVAQWGLPILAGAVVAGWREGAPNRLKTLGLAVAAGMAMDWLFLLALVVGRYYRFDPVAYVVWWGVMGALFGAIGYGLWGPLTRRGPRSHPRSHQAGLSAAPPVRRAQPGARAARTSRTGSGVDGGLGRALTAPRAHRHASGGAAPAQPARGR
jgi:hypothetical protein